MTSNLEHLVYGCGRGTVEASGTFGNTLTCNNARIDNVPVFNRYFQTDVLEGETTTKYVCNNPGCTFNGPNACKAELIITG
jgi:hypothetical protein